MARGIPDPAISALDTILKNMYVRVPIKGAPGEIVVEPCGCVYSSLRRLKTCDKCLQRRLGP